MTRKKDSKANGSTSSGKGDDYKVGYARPPAKHRFQKGKSGNPRGRPKKPEQAIPGSNGYDIASQPANQFLMQEACRPVTIREGNQPIQLPAIQAVFRAMSVSAIKGDRHAQRMLAELVQQVESSDREMRNEYLQTMMEYKISGEKEIKRAELRGLKEPELLPHPDDIILDMFKGEAHICGPKTREEKAEWDAVLARRKMLQDIVTEMSQRHRRARNPDNKALLLKTWRFAQCDFDQINDNLPRRYRSELKDRLFEEGASIPGSQKEVEWPGD